MNSKIGKLKMDFLLQIQINHYDQAEAIAKQILQIDPHEPLMVKFTCFWNQHRQEVKKFDQEELDEDEVEIINDQGEGDWEFDSDQSVSISESEQEQEPKIEQKKQIKKYMPLQSLIKAKLKCCPEGLPTILSKTPATLPKISSTSNLKKSHTAKHMMPMVKSSLLQKPNLLQSSLSSKSFAKYASMTKK